MSMIKTDLFTYKIDIDPKDMKGSFLVYACLFCIWFVSCALLFLQNSTCASSPWSEPAVYYKAQILPKAHHSHTDSHPDPAWKAYPPNSGTQPYPRWVSLKNHLFMHLLSVLMSVLLWYRVFFNRWECWFLKPLIYSDLTILEQHNPQRWVACLYYCTAMARYLADLNSVRC